MQQSSPFKSLILNIIIPVMILNKMERLVPGINPWITLAIALAFPLGYAAYELSTRHKVGLIPALGLFNVLGTGGLAALGLGGVWFATKEAFFPFLIGAVMLGSAFTRRPLGESLFLNATLFKMDAIRAKLQEAGREADLHQTVRHATMWLAACFFLSAVLNFGLAMYVFEPLAEHLSAAEKTQLLNQQVAKMTWMSFGVIALPSSIFTALAFYWLVRSIRKITGLEDGELFNS